MVYATIHFTQFFAILTADGFILYVVLVNCLLLIYTVLELFYKNVTNVRMSADKVNEMLLKIVISRNVFTQKKFFNFLEFYFQLFE